MAKAKKVVKKADTKSGNTIAIWFLVAIIVAAGIGYGIGKGGISKSGQAWYKPQTGTFRGHYESCYNGLSNFTMSGQCKTYNTIARDVNNFCSVANSSVKELSVWSSC